MSDQDVYKRRYGHGSITLTYYRGSGRVSVETSGTNPVMDFSDLIEFVAASGWLNSVKAEVWDETISAYDQAHSWDNLEPWNHLTDNPYRTGGSE